MPTTNGGTWAVRAILALVASGIIAWNSWMTMKLDDLEEELAAQKARHEVLATEKIRNEGQIHDLEKNFTCMVTGECGDRQTRTMTELQNKTRDEQHKRLWDAIERLHSSNDLAELLNPVIKDHKD
jgi:hypothetical protein